MTRDVAYEEVQMRNRQLTDKLEQMEKYIQAKKEVRNIYPRGEKYSREVIFAFSRIAKIAKFCAS